MTKGNAKCPCGSGLKFKRCCRNKGRDPETCRFCGRKEPEVKGEYVALVSKDKSEEPGVFVCNDCYEERRPKDSGLGILPLVLAAGMMWKRR